MLKVRNWAKFQHYKDRNPPWIKLATDTFQNYDFSCLQDASKLLAVCIWTVASRSKDGEVPPDFEWIKRQCNLGDMVKIEHLKELINKGYIDDASNTLAGCKQNACPETEAYKQETEVETETKKKSTSRRKKSTLDYSEEFCSLWKMYPYRDGKPPVGKDLAWNAYIKLSPQEQKLIEPALLGYKKHLGPKGFPKDMVRFIRDNIWKEFVHSYDASWDIDIILVKRPDDSESSSWTKVIPWVSTPLSELRESGLPKEQYRWYARLKIREWLLRKYPKQSHTVEEATEAWQAVQREEANYDQEYDDIN